MTITGTRETLHRDLGWFTDLFRTYLGPWATESTHFYIGGAKGIDSLSLDYLGADTCSRITVVVPGAVHQQPDEAQWAIEQNRGRITEIVELRAPELHAEAFHARNRWMVDRADMTVGFPLAGGGEGSGTWQTLNYATRLGKVRLIVPV
ncbi:hypothetical protein AB0F42_20335 [Streptomyces buecherae]|uniref:hypothetical protein n=1 Tax=Streptomyces buecherae TaxID=2763006 RepID=UPI0033FF367E